MANRDVSQTNHADKGTKGGKGRSKSDTGNQSKERQDGGRATPGKTESSSSDRNRGQNTGQRR